MGGWTTAEPETSVDPIRGQFTLTEEDAQRAVNENAGLKWWHIVFIVPVVLIGVWPILKSGDDALLTIAIPMVFLVVLFCFILILRFRVAGKQLLENMTEAERQLSFHFDASGYRIATPVNAASGQWCAVHRTHEGATTFFIYLATSVFQIVPKRALAEPDVPRLRALFVEHVRPRTSKYAGAGAMRRTLILWVVLIVTFASIWQFLSGGSQRRHSHRHSQPRMEDVKETEETPLQE